MNAKWVLALGLAVLAGCKEQDTLQAGKDSPPPLTATAVMEKQAPEDFRTDVFFGLKSVEGLPAEKVAELEVQGVKGDLERAAQSGEDVAVVRQKELKLGANAAINEAITDVPGKTGIAKQKVTLWLVHAGPFPGSLLKEKHQKVCLVAEIDATGDAYAGGLRAGDIWVQIDATDALAKAQKNPCKELSAASKAVAVGAEAKVTVYRQGAKTELTVKKNSPLLRFMGISVPVLDADKK